MKMESSENIELFSKAFTKFQGELTPAIFNKVNPHFKQKYADFNSCVDSCRKLMGKHELWFSQCVEENEGKFYICTIISHSSGQKMKFYYPLFPASFTSQAFGASVTYGKRYALSAALGIVADEDVNADDDAEEERKDWEKQKTAPMRPQPAPTRPSPSMISKEQVELLNNILPQCSADFKKSVDDFLSQNNIPGIVNLTIEQYKSIYENAKINAVIAKKNEVQNGQNA